MLNWWFIYPHFIKCIFKSDLLALSLSNTFVFYSSIFLFLFLFFFLFFKKTFSFFPIFALICVYDWCLPKMNPTINVGLLNSLSIWHPAILYVSLCLVLCCFFKSSQYLFTSFLFSIIFILLGSWWSAQELLWKGWWNWDGVENSLLVFVLLLFALSHNNKTNIKFTTLSILLLYIYINFGVLNKTNVFKSIHSFTNSLVNNVSVIYICYVFIYFGFFLKKYNKYKVYLWYFSTVCLIFYAHLILFKSYVFSNLNFFFYLNLIFFFYFLIFFKTLLHSALFIALLTGQFKFVFLCVMIQKVTSNNWRYFRQLHFVLLLVIVSFFRIFFFCNFLTTSPTALVHNTQFNVIYANSVFLYSSNCSFDNIFYLRSSVVPIYKNYILSNSSYMFERVDAILNSNKNYKFVLYGGVFNVFIVTEVFYLKQKPRYNYYWNMYLFQTDLTVCQQKNRKITKTINRYNWATKSIYYRKLNFFFTSNQLTIDLRFYKLLLRRIKKKLLKFKAKSFIFIYPNKKTSHKSKNSRMGKGRGINNRFYFRSNKNKPIVIFINFNELRFAKLKLFLSKFFKYKLVVC